MEVVVVSQELAMNEKLSREDFHKLPCVGLRDSQLHGEKLVDAERGKMGEEELANWAKQSEKCRLWRTN